MRFLSAMSFTMFPIMKGPWKSLPASAIAGALLCFMEPAPTFARSIMDWLTFSTPLPNWSAAVRSRYEVMKLEMDTGLYPGFLRRQTEFHSAVRRYFTPIWVRRGFFFSTARWASPSLLRLLVSFRSSNGFPHACQLLLRCSALRVGTLAAGEAS